MTARHLDILGTPVRVVVPPALEAELDAALVDLPAPPANGPLRTISLASTAEGHLRLLDDGQVVLGAVGAEVAVASLVWRLNAVAAATTDHVVLHAGVVAGRAGGVALPGPSAAGKSTLAAAAVGAGFSYLSDEHAALHLTTGLFASCPKPLDLGARGLLPASSLHPGAVAGPCPPAAVVFPRYAAGAPTSCATLDAADALLSLCSQAVNLPSVDEAGFTLLAGLASTVPAWQVTYGSSAAALDVLRQVADDAQAGEPVAPVTVTGPVSPWTSTVVLGDDTVVVLDRRTWAVHRFNDAAGFVWLCAADAHDPAELAGIVHAEAPPGAITVEHVAATIDRFTELGLLGRTTPA